jgi:hypothetical protein
MLASQNTPIDPPIGELASVTEKKSKKVDDEAGITQSARPLVGERVPQSQLVRGRNALEQSRTLGRFEPLRLSLRTNGSPLD